MTTPILASSEQQHGNRGRRHDCGRRQPRVSVSGATVKRPIWSTRTANPHHGCHNGYSHKAVDDGAPKQRFDGIERRKINPNSEDGCSDDYAVESQPPPTACSRGHVPALRFSERIRC